MTATIVLNAAQLELLADTLEIYEAARLGDLNRTADQLRDVCKGLGWTHGLGGGYLPWARETLAIHRFAR